MGNVSFPITAFLTTPQVSPPSGAMDDYYNSLVALGSPTFFDGSTLRSTDAITYLGASAPAFAYDASMNAMKATWPKENSNLNNGPILTLGQSGSEDLTLIWHARYGSMWRLVSQGGAIHPNLQQYTHKEFQVRFKPVASGSAQIAWETRSQFTAGYDTPFAGITSNLECAVYDNRSYLSAGCTSGCTVPGNNPVGEWTNEPVRPTGRGAFLFQTLPLRHSEWMRYICRIKLNVDQTNFPEWEADLGVTLATRLYHQVSMWVQTPRGINCVLFRVPILNTTTAGADRSKVSWLECGEFNSSTSNPAASGIVRVTGTPGATVPGSLTFTDAVSGCDYDNTSVTGVLNGSGYKDCDITSTSQNLGPSQNLAPGTVLTVNSPPVNVDATATTAAGTTGGDWKMSVDGEIHVRDVAALLGYSSAAWNGATPETDSFIFRDMAAWA